MSVNFDRFGFAELVPKDSFFGRECHQTQAKPCIQAFNLQ